MSCADFFVITDLQVKFFSRFYSGNGSIKIKMKFCNVKLSMIHHFNSATKWSKEIVALFLTNIKNVSVSSHFFIFRLFFFYICAS